MIPSPHRRSTNLILLILPGALSVTEFDKQPEGRGRKRKILEHLEIFADAPPGLVLIKAGLWTQLGLSHVQPGPAEAATNCGSLTALSRLPRARHGHHLTLAWTRVPPKNLRTNTPSSQMHTILEQDPTNFTDRISKERLQQVLNSAKHLLNRLYSVVRAKLHTQPAWGLISHTNQPTGIKIQIQ